MSTKRRPIQRGLRAHVSAEMLSLYSHLRTIRNDQAQRAEYVAGEKRLCRLLGLDYWSMLNPLSVDCPEPCYPEGSCQAEAWRAAWEWRQALDAALERQAHAN